MLRKSLTTRGPCIYVHITVPQRVRRTRDLLLAIPAQLHVPISQYTVHILSTSAVSLRHRCYSYIACFLWWQILISLLFAASTKFFINDICWCPISRPISVKLYSYPYTLHAHAIIIASRQLAITSSYIRRCTLMDIAARRSGCRTVLGTVTRW